MTKDKASQEPSQDEVLELRRRVAELEQELASSRRATTDDRKYQLTAIEASLDGIAFIDERGVYIYMNQAHADVHGYDRADELIGQSWTAVISADEQRRFDQEYLPSLLRDGRWRGETVSKRRDGSLHPTDVAVLLVDGGGMVCIVRDVTRRNQVDAELQHSRELLQMVMDHIPQTIFWKDRSSVYLGCNRRFAELAGVASSSEAIGKTDLEMPWRELADVYRADDRRVMESDTPKLHFEESIQRADGNGWARTSKIPLHDATGTVVAVLGLFEDITEHKRAEAERLRLQEEIIRAQADALAELSTPLIPITDTVMVMPLIGKIDSQRAQQVIVTLLSGIAANRARTAILDITGVPVVDTEVANGLVRAARSVRLLGAQVVITGIRPEVAQTLVGLGVDLSGIVTCGTLQRGVAHALGQIDRGS